MTSLIQWLSGKKTLIGGALLSLIGLVGSLDALMNDGHLAWFTTEQYAAAGTLIAGLTGAAMRLAVKKTEKVKETDECNGL